MKKLTEKQALAITGFTGYLACENISIFFTDVAKRLGWHPYTHEYPIIWESQIKPLYKDDFLAMIPGQVDGDVVEVKDDNQ